MSQQNKEIFKSPLVSVCMITYNHRKYVEKSLWNIINQKVSFNIEVVISDDNSSDKTFEFLKHFFISNKIPEHIQFKLFKSKRQKGVFKNFTFALKQCSAKYIALCEGDDFWGDNYKLEKQIDFLEKNKDFVLAFHGVQIIDQNDSIISGSKLSELNKRDFNKNSLLENIYLPTPTLCFRNMNIRFPFYFNYSLNADTLLLAMLTRCGSSKFIFGVSDSFSREHSGSIWSSMSDNYRLYNSLKTYLILYINFNNEERKLYYFIYDQIFAGTLQYYKESRNNLNYFKSGYLYFIFLLLNKKIKKSLLLSIKILKKC